MSGRMSWAECAAAGMTLTEAAAHRHVSAKIARQAAARGGLTFAEDKVGRRTSDDPGRGRDEEVLTWLAWRAKGWSTAQIAERLGSSEIAVRVATNKVRADDRQQPDYDDGAYWGRTS